MLQRIPDKLSHLIIHWDNILNNQGIVIHISLCVISIHKLITYNDVLGYQPNHLSHEFTYIQMYFEIP